MAHFMDCQHSHAKTVLRFYKNKAFLTFLGQFLLHNVATKHNLLLEQKVQHCAPASGVKFVVSLPLSTAQGSTHGHWAEAKGPMQWHPLVLVIVVV